MILEIALGIVLGVGLLLLIRYGIEMMRLVPWELVGLLLAMALAALFFVGTWTHQERFEEVITSLEGWGAPPMPLLGLILLFYGLKYLPAILLLIWVGVTLKQRYGERVWFTTGLRMFKAPFAKGWLGMPKIVAWPVGIFTVLIAAGILVGFIVLLVGAVYKIIVS